MPWADPNVKGYYRLDHGINIRWQWTPLICAAYKGRLELVKLLLKHGADPHEKGYSFSKTKLESAADVAAYSGHLKVLKFLEKKNVELDPDIIFRTVRADMPRLSHTY